MPTENARAVAIQYDPAEIEPKWQQYWEEHQTFRAPGPQDSGFEPSRPKYFCLDFFPYPSGAGLHVGHAEGYTATDILARYRRMRGCNVLHPMGWDAFGLPAEQYAIETNTHPRITTERNITRFRQQLKRLGFSYDWSREFATTDTGYYRWTQWIFLKLYESRYDTAEDRARPIAHLVQQLESERLAVRFDGEIVPAPPAGLQQISGLPGGLRYWHELVPEERRDLLDDHRLAYLAEVPVNWCPALGTVLSNEEVTNEGRSERGDYPVYRRPLRQWMLRITAYAERLARDLDELDWPESVKLMQRNWIGRSEGAEVVFGIEGSDETLRIFTTRPDTLYGTTYMVLAPEHPLVESLTSGAERAAVQRYIAAAMAKSELARTVESKDKTGVFIGAYAINPVWPEGDPRARIPIWVADYVLMGYGTGAIMAVPAHDERDWEFAIRNNLDIRIVVDSAEQRFCNKSPVILNAVDTNLVHSPEGPDVVFRNADGLGGDWMDFPSKQAAHDFFGGKSYSIGDVLPAPCVAEGVAVNSPPTNVCGTGVSPVSSVSGEEHITWRNLPHIQRGGSSYFVTFRTKSAALSEAERTIVLRTCDYWHEKKVTVHAAVVMPDHVHLLLTPHERAPGQWVSLTEILHSIKSYSAHEIAKLLGQSDPVWLDETFDRLIRSESEFVEKWQYIESNPVTTGLASRPSDYRWLILRPIGCQDTCKAKPATHPHRRDAGATENVVGAPDCCDFNGLPTPKAKQRITGWLEDKGLGRFRVQYKLRDWLFSRQRYWGEPFPIVHCGTCGPVALPEDQLPVLLPDMENFRPRELPEDSTADPEPPLGRAGAWTRTTCPQCGRAARRELNTMPNWAGSCWYYLRFADPRNDRALCSKTDERYWMVSHRRDGRPHAGGVDLYLGGAEHAVLHLLYARFWHKVLFDLGHVSTPEPFGKLFNQGMIRAYAYRDERGVPVAYEEIDFREDGAFHRGRGERIEGTVEKMSKSLKNVINPEDVVSEYGADSLRLYEMFMGPLEASKPWNPRDVPGVYRFLQRVWRLAVDPETGERPSRVQSEPATRAMDSDPVERTLHKTIKKVTDDIERMAFNTAIAAMMEFVNTANKAETIRKDQLERLVLLLAPFAPHLAEELWQRLRGKQWRGSLACEPWPGYEPALIADDEIEIAVQVNGKLCTTVRVPADADEERMTSAAQADEKVRARLSGKSVRKIIVVRGRLVNIVVG